MKKTLFVGVDGGGTKSTICLQDEAGQTLGCVESNMANIRISVQETWQAITTALQRLLAPLSLSLYDKRLNLYAGMGLAGTEMESALNDFLATPHPFNELYITSDAHIACLGAHNGGPGAIIIAGTGVIGYQIDGAHISRVSGFGFPHDDPGGGAWLGLEAIKLTLRSLDGRENATPLTSQILQHFVNQQANLITFANTANSTRFATLAPFVINAHQLGDPKATDIIVRAAHEISLIAQALCTKQRNEPLLFCLSGGIAPYLEPYLSPLLRNKLQAAVKSPVEGAIMFVKEQLGVKL